MFAVLQQDSPGPARYLILACMAALVLLIQGCNSGHYNALPPSLENQAQIPGLPDVRAWADTPSQVLRRSAQESFEQEKAAHQGKLPPEVSGLALSGGGGNGAFGAGLLCGWTRAGDRPSFKLVTGISTGALIAPFAFLGPAYDQQLKEAYTTVSDKDIFTPHHTLALLLSATHIRPLMSLASTKPLAELLKKMITAKMLADIATAYRKGRRLFVGTTQLNAQRLVIWDMGAIAASKYPHKLALFRKILLASASLPMVFPPQFFTVAAGGREYQEMHVDGGVRAEFLLYENVIKPFLVSSQRHRRLYIIRNQQVKPSWSYIKPQIMYIANAAIDSLFKSEGFDGTYRLYVYAQRDNLDFNLAYLPRNLPFKSTSEFDTAYMNRLFDYAFNRASKGYPWGKYPPGFSPSPGAAG